MVVPDEYINFCNFYKKLTFLIMLGILILLAIIFYIIDYYKYVRSLPPGPFPLPIIGNLLSADLKKIHLYIYEQKKKYGNVFTVYLPKARVIFADYDTINETLIKNGDNFIGRNVNGYPEKTLHENANTGVLMSEGKEWRGQRRLSLHILKNFGMSRSIMEDKIRLSIDDAINFIENIKNKDDVNIGKIIYLAVGNVINLLLFGFMYKQGQGEDFFEFATALEASIRKRASIESRLFMMFPLIEKVPILGDLIYKRITSPTHNMKLLSNNQIEKCKKTFDPNEEPSNFIHAFMKEVREYDSVYSYLSSDHLSAMVLDFWIAGMETSTTTLKWFILFIMKYPEIQEKLHREIDEVLGRDVVVKMSDKSKMPYMSAFIAEGQRYANIIPFVPSHKCTKDTYISGHLIPKNSLTQPFFWGANMDEKYFKDPFDFNPGRFLDDKGNFKIEHDHMSFGKGKRICVGKSLASTELFLFFTSFLQRYKFSYTKGNVDLTSDFGDVLLARPYTCKIEKR